MASHINILVPSHWPRRMVLSERSESKGGRMQHWVYILHCADSSYYVGTAEDVEDRVARHNAGDGAEYTHRRRPVTLLYSEAHPNEASAILRERQIKRWSRAKKEALIAADMERLRTLSRRRT